MGYRYWLAKHILRERLMCVCGLFLITTSALSSALIPVLLGNLFDSVLAPSRSFSDIAADALVILGLGLAKSLLNFGMYYTTMLLGHRVTRNVTAEYYANMLSKSQSFHDRMKAGDVMTKATSDTMRLSQFVEPALRMFVEAIAMIGFTVYFMISISPKITLVLLLVFPLFLLSMRRYNRRLRPISRARMAQNSAMNSRLQEGISGIRLIRCLSRTTSEIESFAHESKKVKELSIAGGKVSILYYPGLATIFALILAFAWSLWEVIQGRMAPGEFVAFIMLAESLAWPTQFIGYAMPRFQIGFASAERIFGAVVQDEYVTQIEPLRKWEGHPGQVTFQNVSFSFAEDGHYALLDINHTVPAGSTVVLLGPPGSGKSTFVKLVLRLYDPTRGRICVDGIDLRHLPVEDLRRHIGVIEQDVFLFSRSIKENIAYGHPTASQPDIERVARLAEAHEFIQKLPNGYDTIVGERGVMLSGGQKQRIAIARSLLVDPSILIMDDASSAIDSETEHKIQTAMANLLRDRITFIITHRLATIRYADSILVMDGGKISARGTHESLIHTEESYRRLFGMKSAPSQIAAEGGQIS